MINMSASSFEALDFETSEVDKSNKKAAEESHINYLKAEIFPKFIPANKRFQCPQENCIQQFLCNVDALKTHMSIIHKNFKFYLCPHCPPNSRRTNEIKIDEIDFHLLCHTENLYKCQNCDYIDFNRVEMRKHLGNVHQLLTASGNLSNITVIRKSKVEDYSIDRTVTQAEWKCELCTSSNKFTETAYLQHLLLVHKAIVWNTRAMCKNNQEQQALESIEPRMPHSTSGNESRAKTARTSPEQACKREELLNNFGEDECSETESQIKIEKMINMSASSFEALDFETSEVDESNKKVVEESLINNLEAEIFPKFIPANKRFQCPQENCIQQSLCNVDALKTHMSIVHKDYKFYLCPHCPPNSRRTNEIKIDEIDFHLLCHTENLYKCQYCDYIDFNRVEMRKHLENIHQILTASGNLSNITVIRKSKVEDYSIDRTVTQAEWKCELCTSSNKFTETAYIQHLLLVHKAIVWNTRSMCKNNQEQQALESIEPRMPHFTSGNESRAKSARTSPEQACKREELLNNFGEDECSETESQIKIEKMTNMSASSFEALDFETSEVDESNKKVVEESLINNLKAEIFPKFIPANKRFQCPQENCIQQSLCNVDALKTHMSIVHKDYKFYLCPHCPPNSSQNNEVKIDDIDFHLLCHTENLYKCQYCEYIDFNRVEMRKHLENIHQILTASGNLSNIIVIRKSKVEDYSIDRTVTQAEWKCELCTSSNKFTETAYIQHLLLVHKAIVWNTRSMCKNNLEQQALESIEPRMPHSTSGNESRAKSARTSPEQACKREELLNNFGEDECSETESQIKIEKMINLSASSFEALDFETSEVDESNKKVVEESLINNLKAEIFPKFIPANKRFQCPQENCIQQSLCNVDALKTHMSIVHKDYKFYLCPHCPPNSSQNNEFKIDDIDFHLLCHTENLYKCQYCEYIDFNRVEMRKHLENIHQILTASGNLSNIIVIRKSKVEDYSIDRTVTQAEWKCELCTSSNKFTETAYIQHLLLVHKAIVWNTRSMCKNNQEQQALESIEPRMPHSTSGIESSAKSARTSPAHACKRE